MVTNNLDKWWYGLPENTRQAIGDDDTWEKLDMPSRSALHRYSLLRIYGTAKGRDEERMLLNEIACGLGNLALVRKNGIALEDMCNANGEFYDEYQEQFNMLYDCYGHRIENTSWSDWIGHTIPTNRELIRLLEHRGYKHMEVDTDRKKRKLSMFSAVGCTSMQARTCLSTSYRNPAALDWDVLLYASPKTVKAPNLVLTMPGSFWGASFLS